MSPQGHQLLCSGTDLEMKSHLPLRPVYLSISIHWKPIRNESENEATKKHEDLYFWQSSFVYYYFFSFLLAYDIVSGNFHSAHERHREH